MAKTTTAPADPLAALREPVVPALKEAQAARAKCNETIAAVSAAPAQIEVLRQRLVAAMVANDEAEQATIRAQVARLQELVQLGPNFVKDLTDRARDLGLVWSTAWTAYKTALDATLPDFGARHRAIDEQEAAAHAELERKMSELGTL